MAGSRVIAVKVPASADSDYFRIFPFFCLIWKGRVKKAAQNNIRIRKYIHFRIIHGKDLNPTINEWRTQLLIWYHNTNKVKLPSVHNDSIQIETPMQKPDRSNGAQRYVQRAIKENLAGWRSFIQISLFLGGHVTVLGFRRFHSLVHELAQILSEIGTSALLCYCTQDCQCRLSSSHPWELCTLPLRDHPQLLPEN